MELSNLVSDVGILHKTSEEDCAAKRYESYVDYLHQYNKLLKQSRIFSSMDLEEITEVPTNKRAIGPLMGSAAEKAKLREIVNNSEKLLIRLQSLNTSVVKNSDLHKEKLSLPEKVTLKWLWEHLPIRCYITLIVVVVFLVFVGICIAETNLYQETLKPFIADFLGNYNRERGTIPL